MLDLLQMLFVLIISSSPCPQLVSTRTIMCTINQHSLATPYTSLNRSKANLPLSLSHSSLLHNRHPCLRGNSSGTAGRSGHTKSPRPHHCTHQSHLTTHSQNRFRCRHGQCGLVTWPVPHPLHLLGGCTCHNRQGQAASPHHQGVCSQPEQSKCISRVQPQSIDQSIRGRATLSKSIISFTYNAPKSLWYQQTFTRASFKLPDSVSFSPTHTSSLASPTNSDTITTSDTCCSPADPPT